MPNSRSGSAKNPFTPVFWNPFPGQKRKSVKSAQQQLQNLEQTATSQSQDSIPYVRDRQPSQNQKRRQDQGDDRSQKRGLKKFAPVSVFVSILIAFAAMGGFLASQVGFHVHELFTVNTTSDYGIFQKNYRAEVDSALKKANTPEKLIKNLEKQGIKVKSTGANYELDFKGSKITSDNLSSTLSKNAGFREAFTRASRGRISNLYDNAADTLYKGLGIIRNAFKDYKQTGDLEADTESYKKTYSTQFTDQADARINTVEQEDYTDEDGTESTRYVASDEEVNTKNISGDDVTSKATSSIATISNKVAKGVDAANIGCAVQKAGNIISTAATAINMYQPLISFMLQMESISKTKNGEGNAAAMNAQNNAWLKEETTTITNVLTGESEKITGTFMEAEGIKLEVSGETPNFAKLSNYSTNRGFLATIRAITSNNLSTAACTGTQAASAAISLATLAVPGAGIIKLTVGGIIKQIAVNVALQATVAGILSALIPVVAEAFFTNPADLVGVPAGEQAATGAAFHGYLTAVANSGFTPADKNTALQGARLNQSVIAEESEIDRRSRSPFDLSSPNTFLGSIAVKMLPTLSSSSTVSGFLNLAHLATNSFMPKTFADGENTSYLTTFSDSCAITEETNIACHIYDIPSVSTDESTVGLSDNDPDYQNWLYYNTTVDSAGNRQVTPGSFLAEFIELHMGRRSPFGVYDAGVGDRATEYATGGVSAISDAIPYISDVVDLVSLASSAEVDAWARGTICERSSSRWNDCRYAQHFVQQNRIRDQIGYFENSDNPVIAFQQSSGYLNPTDTSTAATLARISGLSRDDSETVLALVDYVNYLAKYNPNNTYPFDGSNHPVLGLGDQKYHLVGLFSGLINQTPISQLVNISKENPSPIVDPSPNDFKKRRQERIA